MSFCLARIKDLYPHAPWLAVSLRYIDTVIATLVVFTTLITVPLPLGAESNLVAQGSPPAVLAAKGVTVTSKVGKETGVSVGCTVGLAVSVGGKGVDVGMAAWVSATIVNAAATAVDCTSTGFIVGTASAPHALMTKVIADIKEEIVKRFMCLKILLMKLTVGEASALSHDALILYNNFPTALGDAEAAKDLKVFLTIDKGGCAVLSHGPG